MNANNTESTQISFELKDTQMKTLEASRQSSDGKLSIKTAVRAGGKTFDCIFFARNAPFSPEYL